MVLLKLVGNTDFCSFWKDTLRKDVDVTIWVGINNVSVRKGYPNITLKITYDGRRSSVIEEKNNFTIHSKRGLSV